MTAPGVVDLREGWRGVKLTQAGRDWILGLIGHELDVMCRVPVLWSDPLKPRPPGPPFWIVDSRPKGLRAWPEWLHERIRVGHEAKPWTDSVLHAERRNATCGEAVDVLSAAGWLEVARAVELWGVSRQRLKRGAL